MPRVRVLLVDDAVVVRRLLTEILSNDPDIEVVGTASNGLLALPKIEQLAPDVVVLDIEMPEMDGIATLKEIRNRWRRLPVIMFSTLTERGARATLDALAAGASDYVTKPSNTGSIAASADQLKAELVPRLKLLGAPFAHRAGASAPPMAPARPAPRRDRPFSGAPARPAPAAVPAAPAAHADHAAVPNHGPIVLKRQPPGPAPRCDAVAIGVSTGGPNALAAMLPTLPAALGVPVLVVQHMPPTFTRLLAERLDKACPLTVVEARHDMLVCPNHVYIAPGDFHMRVVRTGAALHLRLDQEPPENSCRPAVDVLFRSVAEVYGPNALGVVMTGMGQDGLRGAQQMAERGARVLAQDEATSVVWGMPGFVARAGIADAVLPLERIGSEIAARVSRFGAAASAFGGNR